ncbi:MAG: radical SAM protein [Geobacteraceae bacterium]|nr:radical SAM protein [Geobacteraceae bacterium]
MNNRLLLTTAVYPFPSLPQNEAATDVMGQRFTRGNDLFTMVSHTHPCGLHLLAQNLEIPSVVLEYPRWNQFCREVARGYEVIGISAYPFHLDTVFRMCRHIRMVSPSTRILVGSYAAQTLMALGGLEKFGDMIDEIVDGEGVGHLRRHFGEDPSRPVLQRFFPRNGAGLRYLGKQPKGNTVLLFSGLGCPGGCDFCSSSAMYKRKRIELLSPQSVVEHVSHYLERLPGGVTQFYLIDEDYFRFPDYLLEMRRHIADHPELIEQADFVVFGSVDYIARFASTYGWEAIAEAGVGVIFIGVESRNAGENGYGKRDRADAREVFAKLHNLGIRTIGAWIAGFPFQSRETLQEDLDYYISCYPTYQQLSIFSAFPGTPLHEARSNESKEPDCQFADYHFWNPSSTHPDYSNSELLELTEHGYELGYQRWGACLLRNLDVHLNGVEWCEQSESPLLSNHAILLHRKNAAKLYTQLRTMEKYAPNQEVLKRIRSLTSRYHSIFGAATLLQETASWGSLLLATLYTWKCKISPWSPKTEGFRRFIYTPGAAAPDGSPYVIDRLASLDTTYSLKRLIPKVFGRLAALVVSVYLTKQKI